MALTDEGLMKVPGMLSRWARLASGARAHYTTSGEDGPAVVLLHGGIAGSSGTAGFRFMAPYLGSRGFRVYCPDMPAFGLSDTRKEYRPTGLESHVDFLHEFTTALCIDRFHIAGNSLGCMNAVNYVVAHPDRVISYALIAGQIGDLQPPETFVLDSSYTAGYDGSKDGMRATLTSVTKGAAVPDELVEMRQRAAERNAAAYPEFMRRASMYGGFTPWDDESMAARLSTKGRLDRLKVPGIYLYGKQDTILPVENGYAQEDVMPNTQFFYPDDCGHQGQTDQPEMFNKVFEEFFGHGQVTRQTADWAGVSRRRPEIKQLVEQP
jgi:pimeloyl-ACP methyl ester carboxylesterase